MNRMNFMPFKTEKFGKKGFFGGDRASKDSEDGVPQIVSSSTYDIILSTSK